MNAELVGKIEALGYLTHVQHGEHGATALRFRRPVPGGTWGVLVWQEDKLIFCWAVTPDGFRELGAESLLPFIGGPEAFAAYRRRRAETNARAAATRALTAELAATIMPRLIEIKAWRWDGPFVVREAADVPDRWLAGGLACDGKRVAAFMKKIGKGEGSAERDRAAG